MRIGLFTDTYPPYINGVSTSIAMLKTALEKQGHEVFIVTVNADRLKYQNEDKIIRIPGIPIGIYDYRLTGIYPLRAIEKIRKWNLDIIHSHTEFGVGTFARLLAKQFDIPLVHTYHTMYEDYVHYITKGYFNRSSKKIVEYLTKFYCDKTATELIVPTKKTYDLFKEKYKVDRNVHIVPTGIEVERFYKEQFKKPEIDELRHRFGIKKDDFVILFVGRLGEEKSVDLLIEAQASLVRTNPNCKLLIVGDGPDKEKFESLVRKFRLQNHVIMTGKVPWKEVPKYYMLASIFATASKTETQGLTVIEAMAASKPVLAVDDDAFQMVIVNDLNGYLFANKRQYKKLVRNLMEDKNKLDYLSKQARITAESHSSKYFAEKVLDVYKTALGDRYQQKIEKKQKSFIGRLKNNVRRSFRG